MTTGCAHRRTRPSFFLSCLVLCFIHCASLAPPHPSFTDYENLLQYRTRLNVTYNYTPRHFNIERCRYLTEAECRREDEAHEATRQKRVRHRERRLNPNEGDFTVLVLLCKFTDFDNSVPLPTRDDFDVLFNGEGNSTINPVGSIREYLFYASMGKYRVRFDVRDWQTTTNTERYFSRDKSGQSTTDDMQAMFIPLLDKIDDEMSSFLDWGPYDVAGDPMFGSDGLLDHLVVLHSGWAAEMGNNPCAPDTKVRLSHNCMQYCTAQWMPYMRNTHSLTHFVYYFAVSHLVTRMLV
jgi:Immune inhibitor A peptidase M6